MSLPGDSARSSTGTRLIRPRYDTRLHLAHPPSPQQVAQAWDEHPGASGALIVSPTPYGTCADLESIADICHGRGKPLIVDEARGAHLPFHPDLPTWAMDAGADVCVVSVHKMGPGFEPGSVFHRSGALVGVHQCKGVLDALLQDLVRQPRVRESTGELQGPDQQGEQAERPAAG
jgi:lysine decarboxylase